MITLNQLTTFCKAAATQALVDAINQTLVRCDINTPRRLRYFMAQAYHESQAFTHFAEDLYYLDPNRLVAVWPRHFTMQLTDASKAYAPNYVKNSQKLGSLIYANEYGNGDVASGDGYNFRGRGIFGLTFRSNYAACSTDVYGDDRLVQNPDLAAQLPGAVDSAGWFWSHHGFNALADADALTSMTEVLNGSAITVPARLQVLNVANSIF